MLRIATVLAALAAFPAASLAARRADPLPTAPVAAKLVACDVTSSDRSATFYGRMDAVPGAARMQIRFQLLQRLGNDATWDKVDLPALRQWHSSQPGVKRLAWKQTVDALRSGAAYKARIQYRWLSAAGAVLSSASHDTPACRGPLPNVVVGDLTTVAGPTADTRTYRVDVANRGKLDADGVEVSLNVDKAILDTVTVTHLAAGETRTVSFTGPSCGHAVRVTADPDHSIGESLEGDNSKLFACS